MKTDLAEGLTEYATTATGIGVWLGRVALEFEDLILFLLIVLAILAAFATYNALKHCKA